MFFSSFIEQTFLLISYNILFLTKCDRFAKLFQPDHESNLNKSHVIRSIFFYSKTDHGLNQ